MSRKVPQNSDKNPERDVCYTPSYAVEPLLPYLEYFRHDDSINMLKSNVIWESATGEGYIADTLRYYGHTVWESSISGERGILQDFFTMRFKHYRKPGVQITNPPFSLKYRWLPHSLLLGIPFALLLPSATLFAAGCQRLCKAYNISILMPDKRIDFKTPVKGWDSSAQFHSSWFCWGLPGLQKGITYVKLNKPKKLKRSFTDSDMLIYLKES